MQTKTGDSIVVRLCYQSVWSISLEAEVHGQPAGSEVD